MAAITTRQTGTTGVDGVTRKNSPLTNTEIDTNFINLNNNKLESSWTGNTSIVTLGTVATGTWNATTISVAKGGTGLTSTPANGALDIGNGSGFTRTTLTGTTNRISVTNGAGSITLSTPQDIATSSNVQFGSLGVGTAASGTAGEIRATNNITAYYSDERLKTKIGNIENALNKVKQIETLVYRANETAVAFGYDASIEEVGVTAQSVQRVMPQTVAPAPIDERYLTVRYERLVPLLIEAIKELEAQVSDIKTKMEA